MNKNPWLAAIVLFVVGLALGYWMGSTQGYQGGYAKALADAKTTQEEIARKAVEEAVKAANPFQASNPLEGVNANPFEEAARKLNPFAK